MKKKFILVILFLIFLVAISFISFLNLRKEKLSIDYWPMNIEDAENYVWISDDNKMFLINHEPIGMLGLMKKDDSEFPIFFLYGSYDGRFCEYTEELFVIHDGNCVTINEIGEFPKELCFTKVPVFSENELLVKFVKKDSVKLFNGIKKIHFSKCKKDEISPSYFGFDIDSWDGILEEVKYYYYVYWDDGKWGDFYFDDYDGTSSEKYLKFKALLEEGKEDEAMKLVDAFGIQGQ